MVTVKQSDQITETCYSETVLVTESGTIEPPAQISDSGYSSREDDQRERFLA